MTPAQQPDVKARIRAVADAVLGDRADRHILRPVLISTLSVEVNDFVRYHEAAGAEARLRDHAILLRLPAARRVKRTKGRCDSPAV